MSRICLTVSAFALALLGCGDNDRSFDYPLDDQLRLNDLQARGTHNSYHVAPDPFVLPDWAYTHSPLSEQLDGGMRQFELDISLAAEGDHFDVYHIFAVDQGTTCARLSDCLRELKCWSDANPAHHPLFVMLEIKDAFVPELAEDYMALLDAEIDEVWPLDRLITPDSVRGTAPSLRAALAERGWPTLGAVRGRLLIWLLNTDEHRDAYLAGAADLEGRRIFVRGALDEDLAAIQVLDDPVGDAAAISQAVAANQLVRTVIDVVGDDGPEIDPASADAALTGGAHLISTDIESFVIPGGTPSRCNPARALDACTSTAIEDPAFIE